MDQKKEFIIKLIPSILYFGLCTIILLLDFNIWIEGSEEYPKFYIMPIVISLILYIFLIVALEIFKKGKSLESLGSDVDFQKTVYLFIIYLMVIWVPRQFMIWKFGITYEKLPLLYLIVTQIILVEGLILKDFGLKKQNLLKNIILGCLIALLDISIMTLVNIIIPLALEGNNAFSIIETFEIMQFITLAWQMLAVGVSEELFFRGYFFTKMRRSGKSFWYATIFTSIVFMIFHIPWLINADLTLNLSISYVIWRVINTFPFAIVCCVLYEKTGSLAAPIVYHGFSNSLTSFIFLYVSPSSLFLAEILISSIAFFNLLFIALIAPKLVKILKIKK